MTNLNKTTIVNLVMEGKSNKDIAFVLNIKEKTVKWHLTRIYKEYNVKSRTQLIALKTKELDSTKTTQLAINNLTSEVQTYKFQLEWAKKEIIDLKKKLKYYQS